MWLCSSYPHHTYLNIRHFYLAKFEPSIYVIGELGTQAAVLVLGTRGKSWSQYVDYGKSRARLRGQ